MALEDKHRRWEDHLSSCLSARIGLILLPAFFIAFALLVGVCTASFAQEREPVDVIKVNTDLVIFDAQVINRKTKRVIDDLTRDDFEVSDSGVRQQVSYFSRDELPLSIMLLLDVSGSVRPVIHGIRDGALRALQHLRAQDQVAVMAFAASSELVQDFTKDRGLVSEKIEAATASERLGRGTVLGPALDDAALKMEKTPHASRRVIIVITDNIVLTFPRQEKKILQELFDHGTVVYGLIVNGSVFPALGVGAIRGVDEYVEETGGEIVNADRNKVDAKLALVIDRLRARYAIGFKPTNTIEDGRFRRVEIRMASAKKNNEQAVVLTKRGYYFRRR